MCATTCRLRSAENAGTSASSSAQGNNQTRATTHQPQAQVVGAPPRCPSPTPLSKEAASPAASQPTSQGSTQQPHCSSSTEQPVSTSVFSQNPADTESTSANKAGSTTDTVQLVLDVSESRNRVHAILSPVAASAADDIRQSGTEAAAAAAAEPHGDESAAAGSHEAHSHHLADSADDAPTGEHSMAKGSENPSLAELQGLLVEEKKKTAALIGKTLVFWIKHAVQKQAV